MQRVRNLSSGCLTGLSRIDAVRTRHIISISGRIIEPRQTSGTGPGIGFGPKRVSRSESVSRSSSMSALTAAQFRNHVACPCNSYHAVNSLSGRHRLLLLAAERWQFLQMYTCSLTRSWYAFDFESGEYSQTLLAGLVWGCFLSGIRHLTVLMKTLR